VLGGGLAVPCIHNPLTWSRRASGGGRREGPSSGKRR